MLNKLREGHWPIFLLSSISSFTNLFLPIILVRLLSPEDIGFYKIFFIHMSAIPFLFLLGGPIHSVYYWVGKSDSERMKYVQSSWWLTALLSIAVLALGLPLAGLLSKWLAFPLKYTLLFIYSGALPTISSHFGESTIALGNRIKGSVFQTIFEVTKAISFILIAWKTRDIGYVFMSYAIIYSLKFIVSTFFGLKDKTMSFNFDKQKILEVWNYCLPISISGLLGFFVDKIDLLLLSSYLSAENFAFYSMGCLVIPPLIILDMSVQKVLIPKISEHYRKNELSIAGEHFRKAVSDTAFLIIPAIFGLVFFAEPIVTMLYTEEYLSSALYLKIFAIGYLQYIIPHDAVPRATGNSNWILKIYLMTTPISLIGVYFAVKTGRADLALVTAIALKFLPKFFGILYSKKLMKWTWLEVFPYARIAIYSAVALCLSLISLALKGYFSSDLQWFLICAPVFAGIYLSTLYRFRGHL